VFKRLLARHSPGKIEEYYDEDNPVVACPWHGWEFDLKTGETVTAPTRRVRSYPVHVEDGVVSIETERGREHADSAS
jgi:nitrite reductase/ring-hydroxylating ferredoxin subunit